MKSLVEMIVRSLVDYPDEVSINETSGESIMILEINVSPDDVGKVIGKEGRIANAIRTVVKAAAAKLDKKVTVEILTKKEQ
ncbi:RNA-binding protein [bacterium]|nr:RNA-binding protein [bacterium]|tara:strand:- start:1087 stop:1329 length:243 start_codon:yes stop_codon:yes gene_type:complete